MLRTKAELILAKDKTLAKHTVLGGYGTGRWTVESDTDPGVPLILKDDKSYIQLDECSYSEAQKVTTCTLFRMLVRAA